MVPSLPGGHLAPASGLPVLLPDVGRSPARSRGGCRASVSLQKDWEFPWVSKSRFHELISAELGCVTARTGARTLSLISVLSPGRTPPSSGAWRPEVCC